MAAQRSGDTFAYVDAETWRVSERSAKVFLYRLRVWVPGLDGLGVSLMGSRDRCAGDHIGAMTHVRALQYT